MAMHELRLQRSDPGWPAALREIPDPPKRLHLRGALAADFVAGRPWPAAIAVVGARDATAYGLAVARDLGRRLAENGVAVVSGLAVGIDGAAHRGALEAGGITLAVIGCGTDVVYPRPHARLRKDILANGLVLGEHEPGTPALPHHFPQRNRILSALALGVIVVKATQRSGSISTARHALEQGREVFAVPGPINSPRSRGPHALLKQGARLVEGVEDVLAELPTLRSARLQAGTAAAPGPSPLAPRHAAIVEALASGASTPDAIALYLGREVREILGDLLDLELRGTILRGPAGGFAAAPQGRGWTHGQ